MIISGAAYKMSEYLTLGELQTLWFNSMFILTLDSNFKDCEYAVLETAKAMDLSEEKQTKIRETFKNLDFPNINPKKIEVSDKILEALDEHTPDLLQVGNYTLKYGTYIGYETLYDSSGNETVKHTVVINQDGTITHNGNSSKYTVSGNYIIGSNGMPFEVTGNDEFTLEAGSGVDFTYQG